MKRHSFNSAARGLTLVEVMVTLTIFVVLSGFVFLAVKEVVAQWKLSERRRVLYEKAAGVVDIMADDIAVALTREPSGVSEVKCKFIVDIDPQSPNAFRQRLFFVKSFEAGPERAIVGNSGDGRSNEMAVKPPNEDGSYDITDKKIDGDTYTGLKVGDFKALGGMAMVSYFVQDQTLYRAIKAPVEGSMAALANSANAQPIATDVLYLGFDMWSQDTKSWEPAPKGEKSHAGPEKIWDSTRGLSAAPVNRFFLHRGDPGSDVSLNDPDDDVFPRKVRITVVVDSSMPRCLYTKLVDSIGDGDKEIAVEDTRGFADGGDEESYLLIDDEWIKYSKKSEGLFEIEERGARGTHAKEHKGESLVRSGRVFQRVVYIPNWREDTMSDEAYFRRKDAQNRKPKTMMSGK